MVSLTQFGESTAFERFALESTAALRSTERRRSAYYDMRTGRCRIFAYVSAAVSDGDAQRLRLSLRPLMFGAAWKILDLALLHAIDGPADKTVQISAKVKEARSASPPTPFSGTPDLWYRIIDTFEATQELRNGLVHREARVSGERSLTVTRKADGGNDTLNADEQLAFCRLAQLVARALIDGQLDERAIFDISDQLNVLMVFSGQTAKVGRDYQRIFEIVSPLATTEGFVQIDVPTLVKATKDAFPDAGYIDLVGILDENRGTVLVGALDTADQTVHEVSLADLPRWLHVETRLEIGDQISSTS
jgi:hypothetical protein